ncbi:DUF2390 domain-containing protein [Shewanella sp. NFH-SH190041]|uniref:TIGR02444 family protein n=1 Tax=Shewanella sp. NFH-SH190041 TaxID=2950245 RepID=UPI0021C43530|nr:TIGR02444 family protein [Shewanella sp. NFH-SH190041]BDM65726.1 DUF2390 domain-containing protein [Shewanella sp. NFH-SH190041]
MDTFDQRLWQTCEAQYARHKDLCLELQNKYQINVNLLLLAWYLDGQDSGLEPEQWQGLTDTIQSWEDRLLTPYRRLRQLGKPNMTEDEYQKMLDVELTLERKAQQMILRQLNQQEIHHPSHNLRNYLALFNLDENSVAELSADASLLA